ncbi:UDP-3-O-acyl-N-acetylglucosamine deacetylase [Methylobacterium nonmethylotrophicum]|uniref:UDP-3-O-acyl-N-acetylglucosamine deacetylase n=1 Tax=Methylobacterium nonmethylotrophicum TaxID=1141884 RepID=A0A4Z0NX01_9HYPH|nr:UDP-3-O-acyl-N-acetylglucosamine deacetylase [Methylobacterium nonmethylotrophicum]TGE01854.1 UDP-3-0-acyl N-acetylglucosamine deacetylase [Methylobacterium nonmethylotrophicum]
MGLEGCARAAGSGVREATLGRSVSVRGAGLHTGRVARVTLAPAPAGHGIRFAVRCPVTETSTEVPAVASGWVASRMSTSLDLGRGRKLRTIEHLMASLAASGIDNAAIAVEGTEIPILDGSASRWCALIDAAGRVPQERPRQALLIRAPFQVNGMHGFLRAEPGEGFSVDVSTDRLPGFGVLRWSGPIDPASFRTAIAPSRSFGNASLIWRTLLKTRLARTLLPAPTIERLWACSFAAQTVCAAAGPEPTPARPDCERAIAPETQGRMQPRDREPLLRGARPGRVAILLGGRVLGGARFPDEPVRHKILDLVGDLALAGRPILGRIVANCPTHALTFAFLTELMRHPDCWEVVPVAEAEATGRGTTGTDCGAIGTT